MRVSNRGIAWGLAAAALLLGGCGGSSPPGQRAELAALGARIFDDPSLSASRRQSCASCHVAAVGHGQDNALPAQFGGAALDLQGGRVSPSVRYLAFGTAFALGADGAPRGGFFWDGRASSLAEQAGKPFLNPVEMALSSRAELVERLAQAAYAPDFRRLFGDDIFDRVDDAFDAATQALARFQLDDERLRPFSSRYDEFLRGNAALDEAQARGLALFENPAKGNCASCHPSARSDEGKFPLFTDFGYHALGVPRNPALAANADPARFDLGLCAREGGDLAARTDLCGAFKVPSLRNVALRQAFFHNGRFTRLRDAVAFYARRDTHPEEFYPHRSDGSLVRFDDLPVAYHANVVRGVSPYDREPGQTPALSDSEIDDVVAFLRALTDGWRP